MVEEGDVFMGGGKWIFQCPWGGVRRGKSTILEITVYYYKNLFCLDFTLAGKAASFTPKLTCPWRSSIVLGASSAAWPSLLAENFP